MKEGMVVIVRLPTPRLFLVEKNPLTVPWTLGPQLRVPRNVLTVMSDRGKRLIRCLPEVSDEGRHLLLDTYSCHRIPKQDVPETDR